MLCTYLPKISGKRFVHIVFGHIKLQCHCSIRFIFSNMSKYIFLPFVKSNKRNSFYDSHHFQHVDIWGLFASRRCLLNKEILHKIDINNFYLHIPRVFFLGVLKLPTYLSFCDLVHIMVPTSLDLSLVNKTVSPICRM